MRICVIGNSHMACLKLAWERLRSRHAGLELTFFGAAGHGWYEDLVPRAPGFVARNEKLAANLRATSGGLDEIALDAYDAFALVGLLFAPARVLYVAARCSYLDARLDSQKLLVSRECFKAAVDDAVRDTVALRVARVIRDAGRRVLLLPQPHFSVGWRESEQGRRMFPNEPPGCWALLGQIWRECAQEAAREARVELLLQPAETVVDDFFSPEHLRRGAVRLRDLATEFPEDAFDHLNADYGEIALRALLARLVPAAETQTTLA